MCYTIQEQLTKDNDYPPAVAGQCSIAFSYDTGKGETEMSQAKCPNCGGFVTYEPATAHLKCPYCGTEVPIERSETVVEEWDFIQHLEKIESESEVEEAPRHRCSGCGAQISFPPDVTADVCPYCTSPIVPDRKQSRTAIRPRYLLPFNAAAKDINALFAEWIGSLWFAPGDLKRLAKTGEGIKGIYVPYWTYDARTDSEYTGLRGDTYMEAEEVVTVQDGKRVIQTVMVPKIRWTPVGGNVRVNFDDVLVMASRSLPPEHAQMLEPWDLENLTEYDIRYLTGFLAESYQVDLREGFEKARARMNDEIMAAVAGDIGGDAQQVHSLKSAYDDITFKHLLLPVWISAYKYRGTLYRFLVNARTREIQGDRPWSTIKIVLTALGATLVALCISYLLSGVQ